MLKYAIIFAVISLIAGALGFGGVAAGAAGIAKILFGLFLILATIMYLTRKIDWYGESEEPEEKKTGQIGFRN